MNVTLIFIPLFGISGGEVLILFLLVLLLFGPKKIPEIARTLGKGINEIKKVQRDINAEIHRYSDEIENPVKQIKEDIQGFEKDLQSPDETSENDKSKPANTDKKRTSYNDDYFNESANQARDASKSLPHDQLPYPYNTSQSFKDTQSESHPEQKEDKDQKTEDSTKPGKDTEKDTDKDKE